MIADKREAELFQLLYPDGHRMQRSMTGQDEVA